MTEVTDALLQRLRQLLAQDFRNAANNKVSTLSSAVFPTSAADGAEVIYQASASVDWRFRYDAASGYWKFAGGPALSAAGGSLNTSGGTGYIASGVSVAVPLAGDYAVRVFCSIYANNSGASIDARLSVFVAGSAFGPEGFQNGPSGTGGPLVTAADPTGVAVGAAIDVRAKGAVASVNATFSGFRVDVVPVRCR